VSSKFVKNQYFLSRPPVFVISRVFREKRNLLEPNDKQTADSRN